MTKFKMIEKFIEDRLSSGESESLEQAKLALLDMLYVGYLLEYKEGAYSEIMELTSDEVMLYLSTKLQAGRKQYLKVWNEEEQWGLSKNNGSYKKKKHKVYTSLRELKEEMEEGEDLIGVYRVENLSAEEDYYLHS